MEGNPLMAWSLTLNLDEQVYPLRVIQRVIYSLAHDLSILIQQQGEQWVLEITPNDSSNLLGYAADTARTMILRHLNDFALRDQIALETNGLRELFVSVALKECSH